MGPCQYVKRGKEKKALDRAISFRVCRLSVGNAVGLDGNSESQLPSAEAHKIMGHFQRRTAPRRIKRLTIPCCRVDNTTKVLRMVTGKISRKNTGGGVMDIFLSTQLSVPILQIVMLLALSTMSLIFGRIKLALLINYCFTLYWGYVSNLSLFTGDGAFQIANFSFIYFGFGIVIIALAIVGLMYHRD